jgi:hypothetical protein
MSRRIRDHIRSNVWAITACFIALMGSAVVASASDTSAPATKSATATKQIKKLQRKLASVETRLAALEAKPSPVTPAIPTSLPPSGPAGGELAGTYPDPTIGTVSGLDLADSTSPTDGINFGPDTNLYRGSTDFLRTDDAFTVAGQFDARSTVFLGFASTDETILSGFLRLKTLTPPAAGDCDAAGETGRLVYDNGTNELWVCDGAGGWLQILAS